MISGSILSDPVADQIRRLKIQQQSCTTLLLDCLKVRESHPEFAERLDTVIASVEQAMALNAEQLTRLEAQQLYNA